jgi:hypothetical protein
VVYVLDDEQVSPHQLSSETVELIYFGFRWLLFNFDVLGSTAILITSAFHVFSGNKRDVEIFPSTLCFVWPRECWYCGSLYHVCDGNDTEPVLGMQILDCTGKCDE